jgi:glyoxylase-like metal-dependent hydrolase (beta-lactamase superfamily II)
MNETPEYQILALQYAGPAVSSGAFLLWLRDWDKTEERNYYFWCVRGGGRNVIVDSGVAPEPAARREMPHYVEPTAVLARLGLEAREIEHVVLTHLHWDHAGGAPLFPRATYYVQREEYDFWINDPVARRAPFAMLADRECLDYLKGLEGTERLQLIDGDREILPGLECLYAPGHSPALQALAVNTARGAAVLGSDCAHVFANYREDWPSALVSDMPALMRTYEKLRARASDPELIFPGHDRRMADDFPRIAEGVTQLV